MKLPVIALLILMTAGLACAGAEIFFMANSKPNLLLNGGFELGAGTPTSWTPYGTPTCTQTADPRTSSPGSYCTAITSGSQGNVLYQAITTVSGRSYTFTGWLKNVDASSWVKVILYNSAWAEIDYKTVAGTSWEQQSIVWTAADTTYYIYIQIVGTLVRTGRFDDFSVKLS